MRFNLIVAGVSAICAIAIVAPIERADAAGRTRTAQSKLASDPEFSVKGRIVVERREAARKSPERETCTLSLSRMLAHETYSIWMDDPLDDSDSVVRTPPFDVVPRRNRTAVVRFVSGTAQGLPFGATLADLASRRIQVRNAAGTVVVVGTVPTIRKSR